MTDPDILQNLEWNAVTMAAHVAILLSVVFLIINAIRSMGRAHRAPVEPLDLAMPVIAFLSALIVERLYYVAARLIGTAGLNLWEAHPAPELLSGMLAGTVFWIAASVRALGGDPRGLVSRTVISQGLVIVAVFAGLAWRFW